MSINNIVIILWVHSIALIWIAQNNCSVMKDISNNKYQCNIEVIGIDVVVTTVAVFVVGLHNMLM
jgi:hypothetical protein